MVQLKNSHDGRSIIIIILKIYLKPGFSIRAGGQRNYNPGQNTSVHLSNFGQKVENSLYMLDFGDREKSTL